MGFPVRHGDWSFWETCSISLLAKDAFTFLQQKKTNDPDPGEENRVIKPRKNRVPVNFLDNCFRVGMLAGKSEVENRSTKWRK
jgi:hypothetical protein